MSVMMMVISVMFVLTNTPRTVLGLYEATEYFVSNWILDCESKIRQFIFRNIYKILTNDEVTTIPRILECYDRQCQYHVSSFRSGECECFKKSI